MQRDEPREGAQDGSVQDGGSASAGNDYGFSGRGGFAEGSYSSAYGRGSAGARDTPSASGLEGAGSSRGGNALPSPDPTDIANADRRDGNVADDPMARRESGQSER